MASIGNDKGDRKRILFVAPDGSRKTLRLGKMSQKAAEGVCRHVEELLASRISGQPISRQSATWLGELGEVLKGRLAAVGLIESEEKRVKLTLGKLVEEFMAARTDLKPGTRINIEIATRNFLEFLGADKPIEDITEADAEAFVRHLRSSGLAIDTARRRTGRAKQILGYAIKKRLITINPFTGIVCRTGGNKDRQEYVSVETIRAVLEECPSPEWRLIVALSRFAGFRCPSEHLVLKWSNINWDKGRFVIDSPKTGPRVVPIFEELYPFLRESFEQAEPGEDHVILRNRGGAMGNASTTNWGTQFKRIITRASITPWPKVFHALRASCQTDLSAVFPAHVVCEWLGNSEAVAKEHYLMVTESDFNRAAQNPAHEAAQNAAQHGAVPSHTEAHDTAQSQGAVRLGTPQSAPVCSEQMTPRGSEHLSISLQESHIPEERGTVRGTLTQVLTLLQELTPVERQEVLRVLLAEEPRI